MATSQVRGQQRVQPELPEAPTPWTRPVSYPVIERSAYQQYGAAKAVLELHIFESTLTSRDPKAQAAKTEAAAASSKSRPVNLGNVPFP